MTFDTIRDIIVEQLSVDASMVTEDTNLMKDLEADSLDAVEIIMAIEEQFGIEIPDDEAEKFQTVEDLVEYVEQHKYIICILPRLMRRGFCVYGGNAGNCGS